MLLSESAIYHISACFFVLPLWVVRCVVWQTGTSGVVRTSVPGRDTSPTREWNMPAEINHNTSAARIREFRACWFYFSTFFLYWVTRAVVFTCTIYHVVFVMLISVWQTRMSVGDSISGGLSPHVSNVLFSICTVNYVVDGATLPSMSTAHV